MERLDMMLKAAKKMECLSEKYCGETECTDQRMKSVNGEDNCKWYHGGWMYCRLSGIVVTEDYLGNDFTEFFSENHDKDDINVLACGIADFGLLLHIIDRIPKDIIKRVHIYAVDICRTPLELCRWFFQQEETKKYNQVDIIYVKADATKLPFEAGFFNLITSYSFLTRMTSDLAGKVIKEWHRVLKRDGEVLTTIHINGDDGLPIGDFYRSDNEDMEFAMQKVYHFLDHNKELGEDFSEHMITMVERYLENIMSVVVPNNNAVQSMFDIFSYCGIKNVDQPGELEEVHKMTIVKAFK